MRKYFRELGNYRCNLSNCCGYSKVSSLLMVYHCTCDQGIDMQANLEKLKSIEKTEDICLLLLIYFTIINCHVMLEL